MTQTQSNSIREFFAAEHAQPIYCGDVAPTVIDSIRWATYEDYYIAAGRYNDHAGTRVLSVGLLSQRAGEQLWHICSDCADRPDALQWPEIVGAGDDSDSVRAVGYDDLEEEEADQMALTDEMDMDEDDARAHRARVAAEFDKIRKEMTEDSVLVWHDSEGTWEVCNRYPTAWTEDTTHYRIALIADGATL